MMRPFLRRLLRNPADPTRVAVADDAAVRVTLAPLLAQRFAAEALAVPARRRLRGTVAGLQTSRLRGRGMDYLESRDYQPGDDIRHMDWRLTARSGRPHTKLFQEERERSVLLVIDHSAGMRFGTRQCFKSVAAARAAALVAWCVARAGERVGSLGFGAGVTGEVRPAGAARGVLRNLRAWVEWDAIAQHGDDAQPTRLSEALERTRRLARPGRLVVILSDGFATDPASAAPLARLATHGDVVLIQVGDPLETHAPPPDHYMIENDGARRRIGLAGARDAALWVEAFQARRAAYRALAERFALPWFELATADDPARTLAVLASALGRRRRPA